MGEDTTSHGLRARMMRRYWDYLRTMPDADRSMDENARLTKMESYEGLAQMLDVLTEGDEKAAKPGEDKWMANWEKGTTSLTTQLGWIKKWYAIKKWREGAKNDEAKNDEAKNDEAKNSKRGAKGKKHEATGSEAKDDGGKPLPPVSNSISRKPRLASLDALGDDASPEDQVPGPAVQSLRPAQQALPRDQAAQLAQAAQFPPEFPPASQGWLREGLEALAQAQARVVQPHPRVQAAQPALVKQRAPVDWPAPLAQPEHVAQPPPVEQAAPSQARPTEQADAQPAQSRPGSSQEVHIPQTHIQQGHTQQVQATTFAVRAATSQAAPAAQTAHRVTRREELPAAFLRFLRAEHDRNNRRDRRDRRDGRHSADQASHGPGGGGTGLEKKGG